jgi:hypothetical protein
MPTGFQQQQSPDRNLNLVKTTAKPQHGGKPKPEVLKSAEPRSFERMPGRS